MISSMNVDVKSQIIWSMVLIMSNELLVAMKTRLKRIESKIAREVAQSTSKDQNISYTQNTSKTQILL